MLGGRAVFAVVAFRRDAVIAVGQQTCVLRGYIQPWCRHGGYLLAYLAAAHHDAVLEVLSYDGCVDFIEVLDELLSKHRFNGAIPGVKLCQFSAM